MDTNKMTTSKRQSTGKIFLIKQNCKFCTGKKAWSKPSGVFCTRCKKEQ